MADSDALHVTRTKAFSAVWGRKHRKADDLTCFPVHSLKHKRLGLLGSDANFIAMQSIAPGGRAKGTMNLDSDPKNPQVIT